MLDELPARFFHAASESHDSASFTLELNVIRRRPVIQVRYPHIPSLQCEKASIAMYFLGRPWQKYPQWKYILGTLLDVAVKTRK